MARASEKKIAQVEKWGFSIFASTENITMNKHTKNLVKHNFLEIQFRKLTWSVYIFIWACTRNPIFKKMFFICLKTQG